MAALFTVNAAVALFGLAGVLGKSTGLSAPAIVWGRSVFGAAVLLVVLLLTRRPIRVGKSQAIPLIAQGVVLTAHWVTFFQAINIGGVAIGLLSFSTFPLFVAMVEPLVLKRKPTRLEVITSIIILVGVYILVPSASLSSQIFQAVLWGIVSAATFAVLSVYNRHLGQAHHSAVISFYQLATASIILIPLVVWGINHEPWRAIVVPQLAFLGIICTTVAHTIFITSLRTISAMQASVFASLEPVWGIAFAIVLLHEYPSLRSLIGGTLIISATLMVAMRQTRPPRPRAESPQTQPTAP